MKNIDLFKIFFRDSRIIYKTNTRLYLMSYVTFLALSLAAVVPLDYFGLTDGWVVLSALFIGVVSLIIVANVVLKEKARLLNLKKEKLLYGAPTYLVYALYSSLAVLAGIIFLIIPGFIALVFLALAPVASLLSEDKSKGFLKQSIELVKKNIPLVSIYIAVSMFIEILSLVIDMIPDWRIRVAVGVGYAFIEAYFMVVLALISVKIFYYLRDLNR